MAAPTAQRDDGQRGDENEMGRQQVGVDEEGVDAFLQQLLLQLSVQRDAGFGGVFTEHLEHAVQSDEMLIPAAEAEEEGGGDDG